MTAPTGGTGGTGGATGGSPNATVRGVHAPRPIGSMGVRPGSGKPSAPKKPAAKPAKKGRK